MGESSLVAMRARVGAMAAAVSTMGVLLFAPSAFAQARTTAVMVSGQPAPGTPAGTTFAPITFIPRGPTFTDTGVVSFFAFLAGPGVDFSNDIGVWSGPVGGLGLRAREGDQAPGMAPGVLVSDVASTYLSQTDADDVFVYAMLSGAGVTSGNDVALLSGAPGATGVLARRGDAAPGLSGVTFQTFNPDATIDGAARVWFRASLAGTGVTAANASSIWFGTPGSIALALRAGTPAPGTPAGVVFANSLMTARVAPNTAGQCAIRATLAGTGVTAASDTGIWRYDAGAWTLMAREGDQAPGMAPGVLIGALNADNPTMNASGVVAFAGTLTGAGVTMANDSAVFVGTPSSVTPVLREGDPLPALGAGFAVGDLAHSVPVINNAGDLAFRARVVGPGVTPFYEYCVMALRSGVVSVLARNGDQAPGTPTGVQFRGLEVIHPPVMNNAGTIALRPVLMGTGVTTSNNTGLWVTDNVGSLQVRVRRGDLIDVNDDPVATDLRPLGSTELNFAPAIIDGRSQQIDALGQLAVWMTFTDGSAGVFLVAPPCDSIDFNGDGVFPDTQDITDFLAVFSGSPCPTATCGDLDFNNDGVFPDTADVTAFFNVFAGLAC